MFEIKSVSPQSALWPQFIELYGEYFQRCWPEVFGDASTETIAQDNQKLLLERYRQGGRGLFLLFEAQRPLGLANVWLDQERAATLNIAEFYIRTERRRQGLGSALWYAMLQWGQEHGAKQIRLETDADKPANAFWQALGLRLIFVAGYRVCYGGEIPPTPVVAAASNKCRKS